MLLSGLTKESVMKFWTSLLAAVVVLTAGMASAKAGCYYLGPIPVICWLDTKGGAEATCPAAWLTQHKFGATTHTYRFQGSCGVSAGDTAYNTPYKVNSNWDGKVATEITNFGKYGTVIIKASCPYDPWLNLNTPCTLQSATPANPTTEPQYTYMYPPYPRTAFALSSEQKQQLAAEEKAQFQLPLPEVKFITPTCYMSYPISTWFEFKIERSTNIGVAWTFEWRETMLNPFTADHTYKMSGQIISHGNYVRRTIKFGKTGDWRVTAVANFPDAPSASCIVTIN